MEAWQILKIAEAVQHHKGRLTLSMMSDLVRGAGGGAFETTSGAGGKKGKARAKEKADIDLDAVAGGKVDLSKDVCQYFVTLSFTFDVSCILTGHRDVASTPLDFLLLGRIFPPDRIFHQRVRHSWCPGRILFY